MDFKPPPPPVPGEVNGCHEEIATGNGEHPAAMSTAGDGDLQAVNEQSPAAGGSGSLHALSEQTNSGLPVVVQPLTERTAALQADCHEPPVAESAGLQADSHELPVAETANLQAGCRLVRTLRSHAYSAFIWSIQSDGMRKEKIRFLFPIAWYKRGKCS